MDYLMILVLPSLSSATYAYCVFSEFVKRKYTFCDTNDALLNDYLKTYSFTLIPAQFVTLYLNFLLLNFLQ